MSSSKSRSSKSRSSRSSIKKNKKDFYSEDDSNIKTAHDNIKEFYLKQTNEDIIHSENRIEALKANIIQDKITFYRYILKSVTPGAQFTDIDKMIFDRIKYNQELETDKLLTRLKALDITLTKQEEEDMTVSKEEIAHIHKYYIHPSTRKFHEQTGDDLFSALDRWGLPEIWQGPGKSVGGKTLRKTKSKKNTQKHKKYYYT